MKNQTKLNVSLMIIGLLIFFSIFYFSGNFLAITSIKEGDVSATYVNGVLNMFPIVPFVDLADSKIISQGCMINGDNIEPIVVNCPEATSINLENGLYTAYYFVYATSFDNCNQKKPYKFNKLSTQTSFDNNLCVANIPFQSSAKMICSFNAVDNACGLRVALLDSMVYTTTFVVDADVVIDGSSNGSDGGVGVGEVTPWYTIWWNNIANFFMTIFGNEVSYNEN